ncbi:MAG TPA: exonuclease domain-containing protein [Candidatus Polarisedimenticolia bacterium]|nr:exonuclease domain-containing protein [Candidatus Polarisedimenticolia bacterium]
MTSPPEGRPGPFVAFDTETTGLSPVNDRVVEIAALAFDARGVEAESYERLVNPGIPIPPALTMIHGIDDAMVADKPTLDAILPEFIRFVSGAILVAHNAAYDVAMLMVPHARLAHRPGRSSLPPLPGSLVLDTCTLARSVFPGAPNYRLGTVAERLGIPRGRAHRAMPDVRACKELFVRILDRLGPDVSVEDLTRLNGSTLHLGIDDVALDAALQDARVGAGEPLAELREAIRSGSPITIRYQGGTKGGGPRKVTPITLMTVSGGSYMVAHCHLDGGLKNFRLDKITEVGPAATGD